MEPDDEEVMADEEQDEFAAHFNRERSPQVLVTTCRKPSRVMFKFLEDFLTIVPSCYYYARRDYEIKKIVEYAKNREFTDVLVVNENHKKVHVGKCSNVYYH